MFRPTASAINDGGGDPDHSLAVRHLKITNKFDISPIREHLASKFLSSYAQEHDDNKLSCQISLKSV